MVALGLQQIRGALGGLMDEDTHFRMGWLEIRMEAHCGELTAGAGSDRKDDGAAHRVKQIVPEAHLFGNLEEMHDLYSSKQDDDIHPPGDDGADGIAQRLQILGEGPVIDGHGRALHASIGERAEQFRIAGAVLLHGGAHPPKACTKGGVEGGDEFVPGAGLRRRNCDGYAKFAQCGIRFGAAAGDLYLAQGVDETGPVVLRGDDFDQPTNTDPGKKDDEIVLTREEMLRELKRFLIDASGTSRMAGATMASPPAARMSFQSQPRGGFRGRARAVR